MKKRILLICLIMCVLCSTFAFVQADDLFDVAVSDFKLFWNGIEMKFDSPTLLINGQTYIPLREFAETDSMDMIVNWDGENQEIRMTERLFWFDDDIFFETIGWDLPWNAEVINYAYTRSGRDVHLDAKIFIPEDDIEYVKSVMKKIEHHIEDDSDVEFFYDDAERLSKEFEWWDMKDLRRAECAYFGFKDGYDVNTIVIIGFLYKADEDGGYYLYISC